MLICLTDIAKFCRKDSSVPILSDCVAQIIKNKKAQMTARRSIPALPLAEYSVQDLDYINHNSERKTRSSDSDGKGSQKKCKQISSGKVASPDKHGHATAVSKTRRENVDKGSENQVKGLLSGHSRRQSQQCEDASKRIKSTSDFFKIPVPSGGKERMNSNVRSYYQRKNISSTELDEDKYVSCSIYIFSSMLLCVLCAFCVVL